MVTVLGKLYAKRIVNVNVNILLAGFVAIVPTALVVHVVYHHLGQKNPWIINGVTFIADVVFDVVVYYVLHWLANHWPGRHKALAAGEQPKPHLTYFRDATLVQVERMALSPILYGIVFATQHFLLERTEPEIATAAGFLIGILITRVIHTFWMLRQQRKWQAAGKVV